MTVVEAKGNNHERNKHTTLLKTAATMMVGTLATMKTTIWLSQPKKGRKPVILVTTVRGPAIGPTLGTLSFHLKHFSLCSRLHRVSTPFISTPSS